MSLCECGCGQDAGVYPIYTYVAGKNVSGQPKRFVKGHNNRRPISALGGPCECGCGEITGIYTHTEREKGQIKGQPRKVIQGHGRKYKHSSACPRGHLRTKENTVPSNGKCKICAQLLLKEKRENEMGKAALKNSELKCHYGITLLQYEALLSGQNGECAICHEKLDSSKKSLVPHVDHVHNETKQVRGLLCGGCNFGLGHFSDSPKILENAIQYLKETQWNQLFTASSSAMGLGLEAAKILQSQQSLPNEDTYMTFAATASQVS